MMLIWGKIYVFIIKQDILALIAKGEEYVFTIKLNIIALTVRGEAYVCITKLKLYVNCAILQPVIGVEKHMQENNLSELTK